MGETGGEKKWELGLLYKLKNALKIKLNKRKQKRKKIIVLKNLKI